jgi:hypothetical protein
MAREAPDELGPGAVALNLAKSSMSDVIPSDLQFDLGRLPLSYLHSVLTEELALRFPREREARAPTIMSSALSEASRPDSEGVV